MSEFAWKNSRGRKKKKKILWSSFLAGVEVVFRERGFSRGYTERIEGEWSWTSDAETRPLSPKKKRKRNEKKKKGRKKKSCSPRGTVRGAKVHGLVCIYSALCAKRDEEKGKMRGMRREVGGSFSCAIQFIGGLTALLGSCYVNAQTHKLAHISTFTLENKPTFLGRIKGK